MELKKAKVIVIEALKIACKHGIISKEELERDIKVVAALKEPINE